MPSDQDLELPRAYHVLPPYLHVAEQHLAVRCCVCGPRQGGHKGHKGGRRWPHHVETTPRMAGKTGSGSSAMQNAMCHQRRPGHMSSCLKNVERVGKRPLGTATTAARGRRKALTLADYKARR